MAERFPPHLAFLNDPTPGDMAYVVVCRFCDGIVLAHAIAPLTSAVVKEVGNLLLAGAHLYRLPVDLVRRADWELCHCQLA